MSGDGPILKEFLATAGIHAVFWAIALASAGFALLVVLVALDGRWGITSDTLELVSVVAALASFFTVINKLYAWRRIKQIEARGKVPILDDEVF